MRFDGPSGISPNDSTKVGGFKRLQTQYQQNQQRMTEINNKLQNYFNNSEKTDSTSTQTDNTQKNLEDTKKEIQRIQEEVLKEMEEMRDAEKKDIKNNSIHFSLE